MQDEKTMDTYPHYDKYDDTDTYYVSGHGRASEEDRNNDTF